MACTRRVVGKIELLGVVVGWVCGGEKGEVLRELQEMAVTFINQLLT